MTKRDPEISWTRLSVDATLLNRSAFEVEVRGASATPGGYLALISVRRIHAQALLVDDIDRLSLHLQKHLVLGDRFAWLEPSEFAILGRVGTWEVAISERVQLLVDGLRNIDSLSTYELGFEVWNTPSDPQRIWSVARDRLERAQAEGQSILPISIRSTAFRRGLG